MGLDFSSSAQPKQIQDIYHFYQYPTHILLIFTNFQYLLKYIPAHKSANKSKKLLKCPEKSDDAEARKNIPS